MRGKSPAPTGWLRPGSSAFAEYFPCHPHRRYEYVCRIGEECRLVSLNDMSQPCQRKRSGNQKERDDPVKPDDDDGREADGNCDQVQCAIDRMVVRAIVMRVEAH